MKKKIGFVITSITDNGVTRVVSILLDEIDYEKYDVSVVLTRKVARKGTLNEKARILEVSRDINGGLRGKIGNIAALRSIFKTEKFDEIVILGDYAALYTLLACTGIKCRKIVSERNDPNREPDKKAFRQLRDVLYRHVDAIVCQTSDASEYFKKIVKRRIVIPNPVSSALPEPYRGEREKRIVNFCRIDTQKNLPLLIDAFSDFSASHPGYVLEIYGNGPEEKAIQSYIESRKLQEVIIMKPFCRDIHQKILSAGMFVSSSDFEGMSNSMLEAMAIGLPVICTDCPIGGAHEVIRQGENGILVPVNDRAALTAAMCKVADDPEMARQLGENAHLICEELSKEMICAKWWALIDEE